MAHRFSGSFPCIPLSVGVIRGEVAAIAAECGLEGQRLHDVVLAVSEAATNAVLHGAAGPDACVHVTVDMADGEVRVVVRDEGAGVKPKLDSTGAGLGMPVIATLAKRVDFISSDQGTQVHMAFPCPAAR